jgi:pseudouridine-5'-phosphate glycosidase
MVTGILRLHVRLGDEVAAALQEGRPIVALESAVITHGLPEPHNLEAARSMAEAVRAGGAVPAICLVDESQLWIGAGLERAAAVARNPKREKASVRDLGAAISMRIAAGLTVSATLFAAGLAGIRVFATGGIGGVHSPTISGDVSADLLQLGRSPVITVCSGAKSVLDIPRTLEFLETAGVPVFSYRTPDFPGFYLSKSGVSTPVLSSPGEVARAARTQWELGLEIGLVLGNPIPAEERIPDEEWRGWFDEAQLSAERDGMRGKAVTPYLLGRVATLSGGRTVQANLALLQSNASLAAEVAVALGS